MLTKTVVKIRFMMMTVIVMANVFPEIAGKKSEIKYTGERGRCHKLKLHK